MIRRRVVARPALVLAAVVASVVIGGAVVVACEAETPYTAVAEGEGEGEGTVVAEGEGEGTVVAEGEGEGTVAEGEGEGTVVVAEGEGEGIVVVGEGEGEGEGVVPAEGEGEGAPSGTSCTSSSGCTAPAVCRPVASGTTVQFQCSAPGTGNNVVGMLCAGNSDCASGLCIDANGAKTCSAPCTGEGDCPLNQNCSGPQTVTVGNATTTAQVCFAAPAAELPTLACTADNDCSARGQTCSRLSAAVPKTLVCDHPAGGDAAIGGSCTLSFNDQTTCADGLCDSPGNGVAGQCTGACDTDADCGPGFACTGEPLSGMVGRVCAQSCTALSDCGYDNAVDTSRICQRRCDKNDPDVAGRAFELVCSVAGSGAALDPGTVFTSPQTINDCKTLFAISSGIGTYCSMPCDPSTTGGRSRDTDCAAFGMTCTFDSSTVCGSKTDCNPTTPCSNGESCLSTNAQGAGKCGFSVDSFTYCAK